MTQPADDLTERLREQITTGELPPGHVLPPVREAPEAWGVTVRVARTAYDRLTAEGLLRGSRGRGTIVVGPDLQAMPVDTKVYRDELGYYFGSATQALRLVGRPTVALAPATMQVARRLHVEPGALVVVRDRVLGKRGTKRVRPTPMQIATSYLPAWLYEALPIVGEVTTGPGGIYDRIEEWAAGPLRWPDPTYGAVNATVEDGKRLRVSAGTALAVRYRVAILGDGRPVELNVTKLDGAQFEFQALEIERDESAWWPPSPAVESPQVTDEDE
jgi:GntR family transcriptional regulator